MTAAIMLAAGSASRFGIGHKLLQPAHGIPLIALTVLRLLEAGPAPLIVVLGCRAPAVLAALRRHVGRPSVLRIVVNRRYRDGQAGSIRAGVRALPLAQQRDLLLCLGDMPGPDRRLIRRLRAARRHRIDFVRPMHAGHPGHPVLFASGYASRLYELKNDRGARSMLQRIPADRRRYLASPGSSVLDGDTPAALRSLRHRLARHQGCATLLDPSPGGSRGCSTCDRASARRCRINTQTRFIR